MKIVVAKTCSKCGKMKPRAEFHRRVLSGDGMAASCKGCCRKARDKLRKQVFGHYGWRCACCGATENLTIDHVNGNGGEHRRELFGTRRSSSSEFYRWLVRNGLPDGYQTLCSSCNNSKGTGESCRLAHTELAPAL